MNSSGVEDTQDIKSLVSLAEVFAELLVCHDDRA